MENKDKDNELISPKECSVCGTKLQALYPLQDSNGNLFCPEHYKEFGLSESKESNSENLLLG